MKVIETRPREIGFVLWGHCQNLLDDPRTLVQSKNELFRTWDFGTHRICAKTYFNPYKTSILFEDIDKQCISMNRVSPVCLQNVLLKAE